VTLATSSLSLGGFNVPIPPLADILACMLAHSFAFLAILKTTPMDETELLTVSQAAEAFSATSQTIRNWIRGDRIKSVRIGNRFLIPRSEVERLRGEISAARGEGTWEHEPGRPPDPLVRRARERQPDGDPTDGLLGA
jgi:excisionase family DNA binding protein